MAFFVWFVMLRASVNIQGQSYELARN